MISRIRKYFDTQELVCKHVYERFGDDALKFFDHRLLETLLFIREGMNKPIYVNNWQIGGSLTQRGLRCCVCPLVKTKSDLKKVYMSSHIFGRGIDFDVKGMSPKEVKDWIVAHQDELPYPIRIELNTPTLTHLDVCEYAMRGDKITWVNG